MKSNCIVEIASTSIVEHIAKILNNILSIVTEVLGIKYNVAINKIDIKYKVSTVMKQQVRHTFRSSVQQEN